MLGGKVELQSMQKRLDAVSSRNRRSGSGRGGAAHHVGQPCDPAPGVASGRWWERGRAVHAVSPEVGHAAGPRAAAALAVRVVIIRSWPAGAGRRIFGFELAVLVDSARANGRSNQPIREATAGMLRSVEGGHLAESGTGGAEGSRGLMWRQIFVGRAGSILRGAKDDNPARPAPFGPRRRHFA